MAFSINAVDRPVPRSRSTCFGVIMTDLFNHIEKQTLGQVNADEMRKGCRLWFIIFGIAITVIVIAGFSIWRQLQ